KKIAVGANSPALVDAETGEQVRIVQGQAYYSALAPDGRTIAGWPNDKQLRLWETATGKERGRIPGKLAAVTISPDGKLLAAADRDETIIRIWDLHRLKEIQRIDGHDSDVLSLAFSADGKLLASGGGDFVVHFWDMADARNELRRPPLALSRRDAESRWA